MALNRERKSCQLFIVVFRPSRIVSIVHRCVPHQRRRENKICSIDISDSTSTFSPSPTVFRLRTSYEGRSPHSVNFKTNATTIFDRILNRFPPAQQPFSTESSTVFLLRNHFRPSPQPFSSCATMTKSSVLLLRAVISVLLLRAVVAVAPNEVEDLCMIDEQEPVWLPLLRSWLSLSWRTS